MKRCNYVLSHLFFICLAIITSCKKQEIEPAKSKVELLAGTFSKSWKISDEQVSSGGKTGSIFFMRETCAQDDLIVFFYNQNFEKQEGTNTCDTNESINTGKWGLSSDKKAVIMEVNGFSEVWKIKNLNSATLTLEMADTNFEGLTTTVTYTAQK